jgi:hypothetical protein
MFKPKVIAREHLPAHAAINERRIIAVVIRRYLKTTCGSPSPLIIKMKKSQISTIKAMAGMTGSNLLTVSFFSST